MWKITPKKAIILFCFYLILIFVCAKNVNAELCHFPDCAINYAAEGSIYTDKSAVIINEPFNITISGRDNNGLYQFILYENGDKRSKSVSSDSTSATKTWQIKEKKPGTYTFCGQVAGYNPASSSISCQTYSCLGKEYVKTSPNCVSVSVYCSSLLNNSCGYGYCASSQKPNWKADINGNCTYECVIDYSCVPTCECSTGSCCDGCHYKSSTATCNSRVQTEYACPWGQSCGISVGQRIKTQYQYCSGNDAQCSGIWGNYIFGSWITANYCSADEVCIAGNPKCQKSSQCNASQTGFVPAPNVPINPSGESSVSLGISFLGKTATSNDWIKNFNAKPNENIDFMIILTNRQNAELQNVNVKAEMPKETTYKGDLKIDGISLDGNITSGINIEKLPAGSIKIISFTGRAQNTNLIGKETSEANFVARAAVQNNVSSSDSLKITFAKSRTTAAVGLASLQFIFSKWYFWVIIIIFGLFIFYSIFKKLFLAEPQ